jgi:uncharacterized membrane protein
MTAIGRRGSWEPSASSERNSAEEHRRAATGYLLWPVAFADFVREGDDGTLWARFHSRQAFVFGALSFVAFLVVLALPLVAVLATPAITTGTTIAIYIAGLIADALAVITITVLTVRFSARAARGELFEIPLVSPIVDRFFRVRGR